AGALVALTFCAAETQAAQRNRLDRKEVEKLVSRIEKGANRFKKSVDSALDNSRYNQTRTETEINTYVREFENATDRLKKNTKRGDLSERDAREVLGRADRIDRFMDRVRLNARAENDWDSLRRELDQLPRLHRFAWQWGGRGRPGWRDSGYGDRDRDRDRGDWRDRDRGNGDRRNDADIHGIVAQIEAGANRFRSSLGNALDEGRLNQTATERLINQYVREFENATNRLKRRVQSGQPTGADTREVLQRGDKIDGFMRSNRLNQRAQRDWTALRNDLDALARATRISWRWGGR
ncbi:MAG: hypothetical protein ACRD5G_03325, partial [Candidatus Acidiferrales bacterium]